MQPMQILLQRKCQRERDAGDKVISAVPAISNANEILATGIANPGLTCQNKFQNSSAPSSLSPG